MTGPSDREQTITGACLCGAVTYAAQCRLSEAVHCHCRMCQRATGAAFATWVPSPEQATRLTGPVTLYRSSDRCRRGFCGHCGSTVLMDYDDDSDVYLALGTMDAPERAVPAASIWTRTRLACVHGIDRGLDQRCGDG